MSTQLEFSNWCAFSTFPGGSGEAFRATTHPCGNACRATATGWEAHERHLSQWAVQSMHSAGWFELCGSPSSIGPTETSS